MNLPGWHLHGLNGNLAGQYSVGVNANWRLTFAFEGQNAILVDYQDYHQEPKMMFQPPHPGEALREDVLPALKLSVTAAALQLGVSRVAFTRVLQGQAAVSIDLARRLELWLRRPDGSGPSAESWLRNQLQYDLWRANQEPAPLVQPAAWVETADA